MYPDYRDVTVPCNIAPLNFHYTGSGFGKTVFEANGAEAVFHGKDIKWELAEWKQLLEAAAGDTISVRNKAIGEWKIAVSRDSIDSYLTYRLIEPAYEVWDRVEIRERNISSFEERALSDWQHTENSCMNCHIHKGSNTLFYLRGAKGGAFLGRDGKIRKLDLKNADMISSTVYGDLHPSGRWGVFSTNIIIPGLHTAGSRRMEVFDRKSDLTVADFDGNRMINDPAYSSEKDFETFPCFSADGNSVYYCSVPSCQLPQNIDSTRYSIYRTTFDPETGALGAVPELFWDAEAHGASACHPKCSPDGKWLMFTVADYGTFPIFHRECELNLINLETGEIDSMAGVNSEVSDTYHSWSSNSRWFVFASKRSDGIYGKPFICHIDENGDMGKPFLLPQEDPYLYEKILKSFNIPDLGIAPALYDAALIGDLRETMEAEAFNCAL